VTLPAASRTNVLNHPTFFWNRRPVQNVARLDCSLSYTSPSLVPFSSSVLFVDVRPFVVTFFRTMAVCACGERDRLVVQKRHMSPCQLLAVVCRDSVRPSGHQAVRPSVPLLAASRVSFLDSLLRGVMSSPCAVLDRSRLPFEIVQSV
jgi:hypothetical protein